MSHLDRNVTSLSLSAISSSLPQQQIHHHLATAVERISGKEQHRPT
jgi:hypothetical protein